jgi:hypothetical protein
MKHTQKCVQSQSFLIFCYGLKNYYLDLSTWDLREERQNHKKQIKEKLSTNYIQDTKKKNLCVNEFLFPGEVQ